VPGYLDFITQLAEVSYDPFFVIDQDHRITHYNHPFDLMLALSAADRRKIVGTPFEKLLDLDETAQACIRDCLSSDSNVRVQSATGTAAGRKIVLDLSTLPLRDERGKVAAVLVLFRDVSDEQRLRDRHKTEKREHLTERESLLRIIADRDKEIERLKRQNE
jgi:PAS domain S-box-containing protein